MEPNQKPPLQQQQSPLGRLAGELRNHIYNEVIAAQTKDSVAIVAADADHLQLVPFNLARTCRLFRLELSPIANKQTDTIIKQARHLTVNAKENATSSETERILGLGSNSRTDARRVHFKLCVPRSLFFYITMSNLRSWGDAVSEASWENMSIGSIARPFTYSIGFPADIIDLDKIRKHTRDELVLATFLGDGSASDDELRFWQGCMEAVKALQEKHANGYSS